MQGERRVVTAALERSRASSARTKAVRILWRTLASLALVEESEGRAEEAARLRTEAAEIVERIARSLEVVGLAERFRALPEVRALLPAEAAAP